MLSKTSTTIAVSLILLFRYFEGNRTTPKKAKQINKGITLTIRHQAVTIRKAE